MQGASLVCWVGGWVEITLVGACRDCLTAASKTISAVHGNASGMQYINCRGEPEKVRRHGIHV